MTKREKLVIRILLVIAQLIAPTEWSKEVKTLSDHLSVNMPEETAG